MSSKEDLLTEEPAVQGQLNSALHRLRQQPALRS